MHSSMRRFISLLALVTLWASLVLPATVMASTGTTPAQSLGSPSLIAPAQTPILTSPSASPPMPEPSGAERQQKPGYTAGELIVRFSPQAGQSFSTPNPGETATGTGIPSLDALGATHGLRTMEPVFQRHAQAKTAAVTEGLAPKPSLGDVYKLVFSGETDVEQLAIDYGADPNVVYAEPNYLFEFDVEPNDPSFGQQWYLSNTGQYILYDADVDAPEAWDIVTGTESIVIAVIDTGIDRDHPDLDDHIWSNPGETPDNGADDDGNGYVDDTWGWNWASDASDPDDYELDNPRDDNGHGTHVAGIAAAETDNGIGVAGVCWGCKIMSLKAFKYNGTGTTTDIVQAIDYAAEKGADVINMSFGSYAQSLLLEETLALAYGQAVLVAAAGNYGKTPGATAPYYPAAYPYVLGVGATDAGCVMRDPGTMACLLIDEHRADFSNHGINADVGAPGVSIYSTFRGDSYASMSGTSMAAPVVSGLAALILSQHPTWSKELARGQIVKTTDSIYTDPGTAFTAVGSGRVNAHSAVTVTPTPDVHLLEDSIVYGDSTGDGDGLPDAGEILTLTLELKNYWGEAGSTAAVLSTSDPYVSIPDDTASFGDISAYATLRNDLDPFQLVLDSSAPNNHQVDLTLDVTTNGGAYDTTAGFSFLVQRGIEIPDPLFPAVITADMTLHSDYLYIVKQNMLVSQGVTLTIEPGTRLQFDPTTFIKIEGTLVASGTEELPIYFTSNQKEPQPGDFRHLFFAPGSQDAVFSGETYVAGSILNHVVMEYGDGLLLIDSSPHIANSTFRRNRGAQHPVESYAPGAIAVYGDLSSTLRIEHSVISETDSSSGIAVHATGGGDVVIRGNTIRSNYSSSYGGVGIRIEHSPDGGVVIRENDVSYNSSKWPGPGGGIALFDSGIVERNYIFGNSTDFGGAGLYATDGQIRHNVIAGNVDWSGWGPGNSRQNQGGSAMQIGGFPDSVEFNTIVSNVAKPQPMNSESVAGHTILVEPTPYTYTLQHNNILGNSASFDLYLSNYGGTRADVDGRYNYWASTDVNEIRYDRIYDYWQDFEPGEATFQPFLTAPEPLAPGFLWDATTQPADPVGAETMDITLDFSKDMNTAIPPEVTFGVVEPYTQHTIENGEWVSPTRWIGSYQVSVDTGDGINTLRVVGAEDADGMRIPEDTRFQFVIQTAGTQAVLLEAVADVGQVDLTWTQNDVADLAGYILYRSAYTNTNYAQIGDGMVVTTAFTDTEVTNGVTYYYQYSVLDTDFNEVAWSNEVSVTPDDYTLPETPVVTDDGITTHYFDRLHASWASDDPETGITEYRICIGTAPETCDTVSWTSMGTVTETTKTGLNLIDGETYHVNVKARNGADHWSAVGASDGITVDKLPPPTITALHPVSGVRTVDVTVTITGTDLTTSTTRLGGAPLHNVTVLSPTLMTATVPANSLFAGVYTLTVTSFDSQVGTLSHAYTATNPVVGPRPLLFSPSTRRVGDDETSTTVEVQVQDVTDLAAFQFDVTYDPAVVRVDDVSLGWFLGSGGRSTAPLGPETDNAAGRVTFGAFGYGSGSGAEGSGTLATITFSPQATGTASLTFENQQLRDSLNSEIPADLHTGQIQVVRYPFGDFDRDCDVDIADIMVVASRWNSFPGDPDYDPAYDFDGDGDIDVADIMQVASAWGDSCPGSMTVAGSPVQSKAMLSGEDLGAGIVFEPPATIARAGTPFTVTIAINDATDLGGFEFDLLFDQEAITVTGAYLGAFLGSSGNQVSALGPVLEDSGRLVFGAFSYGEYRGASGEGSLVTLELELLEDAETILRLEDVQLITSGAEPAPLQYVGELQIRTGIRVYLPVILRQY